MKRFCAVQTIRPASFSAPEKYYVCLMNLYISYQEQCTLFFTPAPLTPENHAVVIGSYV